MMCMSDRHASNTHHIALNKWKQINYKPCSEVDLGHVTSTLTMNNTLTKHIWLNLSIIERNYYYLIYYFVVLHYLIIYGNVCDSNKLKNTYSKSHIK